MRGRKQSTLIPESHLKTATFSVKIPSDVIDKHEKIKADAASLGYVFDTQNIVTSALTQALNHAERELERLLGGKPEKQG
jgi:hypothetical protein